MVYNCYAWEKFKQDQNFRFQSASASTKHVNLREYIRNEFIFNRLQSSSVLRANPVNKRISKFVGNQPKIPPNSADEVILQKVRDDAIFYCTLTWMVYGAPRRFRVQHGALEGARELKR